MLAAAWNTVTTKIVVNCFRKVKLLNETQKVTIAEDNDPFKEWKKSLRTSVQFNRVMFQGAWMELPLRTFMQKF